MTSTEIIEKRDNLSQEITRTWNIIKTENVIPTGYIRNYNMKALLEKIVSLSKERIEIKLCSLAVNLGFEDINDLPKNAYPIIYKLSELNEMYIQLERIRTIHWKTKKYGGDKLKETEELTKGYIENYRSKLSVEINKLKKDLIDFNVNRELKTTKRVVKLKFTVTKKAA